MDLHIHFPNTGAQSGASRHWFVEATEILREVGSYTIEDVFSYIGWLVMGRV